MSRVTPRVLHFAWGSIDTEGAHHFKDAKIFPGGARAWDWRETGTQHVPGIQVADAEELLDAGADVVVLSRGVQLVLQVPATTVAALEALGVEVHVAQTEEAVRLLNDLAAKGRRVGALLHSTC